MAICVIEKNDGHKIHHSFLWTNGRKIYELSIILLENLKAAILATNKKIIKAEITWKHCGRGKARLLLIFIKTPESGSATWILLRIHEFKSWAYHDLGFAPYSLRGVASKDTDIPNRFQAGIIKKNIFLKYFFADLKTIFFSSFHTSDFFIFIAFLDFITKKVRNKKK